MAESSRIAIDQLTRVTWSRLPQSINTIANSRTPIRFYPFIHLILSPTQQTHKSTMFHFQQHRSLLCVLVLIFTVAVERCQGFASHGMHTSTAARDSSTMMMYMPRQSENQANEALKMIPNPASLGHTMRDQQNKKGKQENPQRRYTTELSNSVLHECNTLPSFPTAHGILSPETVMRMEEMAEYDGCSSEAVDRFLKQYRRHGPMSCLSMLSDPEVLPHLTRAMRNVV